MTHSPLLTNDGSSLYSQVAFRIQSWIQDGTLKPGTKIPSVRDLSQKLTVSVSTVLQAYNLLESQGHIEAKPQSGYYVKIKPLTNDIAIQSKPRSAPRFVQTQDAFLNAVRSCGEPDLVPFGGAVIHSSLLPTASLQKSLSKIAREHGDECIGYAKTIGNWRLRLELSKRSLQMGCDSIDPENILITSGCMEAINIALKTVTKAGDIVAVESPTYYGMLHALECLGLKVLELPTSSKTGIDLNYFEEKLKTFPVKAAIITPSFLNPIGSLMTDEDKDKLVRLCSKHNVTLIEDDIYAELKHSGQRPLSLKSFDKKDQVFFCSSFSKTLSAGHRIGWMIPPKKLLDRVELIKFSLSVATSTASQLAIADHLETHNFDRHLRKLRQTLGQNMHLFSEKIAECFPKNTKMTNPEGGCLIWVEMPESVNALELHLKALKEKISVIPGPVFSASGKYQNCIRLNCGSVWDKTTDQALEKLATLAYKLL